MASLASFRAEEKADAKAETGLAAALCPDVSIQISLTLEDVEDDWRALEARFPRSVFQSFDWLHAWTNTLGRNARRGIRIVVGRDPETGDPRFLLPLAIRRKGAVNVLTWLALGHAGYQSGIYDEHWLCDRTEASQDSILARVAAEVPECDAVHLCDQPDRVGQMANPLLSSGRQLSPNTSYVLDLDKPFDDLYAQKRSASTRRGARKRERKLESEGRVSFERASGRDEIGVYFDEMMNMKTAQMHQIGVGELFGPEFRDFVMALDARTGGRAPEVLLHRLRVGNETLASIFGATYRGTFYGMILTMSEGPLSRYSPGDLVLRRSIESACAAGLDHYDLSQGDADYKLAWKDREIALYETIMPLSTLGMTYALVLRTGIWVKRKVKHTPPLFAVAKRVRRALLHARITMRDTFISGR